MLKRINRLIILTVMGLGSLRCTSSIERKSDYFLKSGLMIKPVYKQVKWEVQDTIENWIKMDLMYFHQFNINDKYQIDDYILFNSKEDKCLVNLLIQSNYNEKLDDVFFILGEKINDQWWFYQGPDLTIIQSVYDDDPNVLALPFSTLSQIARKNTLSWYYIEKPSGTCLKKLFSEGYDSYKKCSDEKYIINDEYFETGFNWEADRKSYPDFLKDRFKIDSTQLNQ